VVIQCTDWVNIIPVTLDDQIVLVRQFRVGVWSNSLEIPGGMVDPGESPQRAAVRELEEETGYVPGHVIPLGSVHPNPALQANRCHSFLALGCNRTSDVSLDAGEDIEVVLRPRREIPEMLWNGEISHSLVLAAFLRERLYWESETAQKRFGPRE
jgi:8-oxo-dGTP pyrophosphatase MutT (NUDIX family)